MQRKFALKTIPVVLLIFAIIAVLKSSIYHSSMIVGNDLLWHIEYGKYFINHYTLPTGDWLTWTSTDQPYQITQWLGELLLTMPYYFGGSQYLAITVAAIGCSTLLFSWRTAIVYIKNPVLALLIAIVTIFPIFTLNSRPQLFGFTAFSALVWVLTVWVEKKERWTLFAMPLIMIFWVNVHGSFVVGLAYIAALGGGAWLFTYAKLNGRFMDSVRFHGPLALASFAAIFAVLINPYGWRAFEAVAKISQLETSKSGVISEWAATSLTTMHGESFFIISFCILVSIAMAKERPDAKTIIGFIGTAYFGLSADRQTFFALIAMVPFFAKSMCASEMEILFNQKLAIHIKPLRAVLVLCLSVSLSFFVHSGIEKHIEDRFTQSYPVKAIAFLNKNNIEGKLFNKIEYGGYIESVGRKPFIDGRLDLFGDEMVIGTINALNGKPGWDKFLAKYNPDLYVLDNTDPLKELLILKSGCEYIYMDDFHSVIKC